MSRLPNKAVSSYLHCAEGFDLANLLALKDACITRIRADGIEPWDEVYPATAVLARDLAAGTFD